MTKQIWTPFDCLPVASQTPSGLLKLEEFEVDILQRSSVQLRSAMADKMEPIGPPINAEGLVDTAVVSCRNWSDRTETNLTLQLTTHRLVLWQTNLVRTARYVHLSSILCSRAEIASSLFSSKKLLLNTFFGDLFLVFGGSNPCDFLSCLQKTIERQEWTKISTKTNEQTKRLTNRKVGVDAVLAKSKLKYQQEQKISEEALAAQDADDLIQEATELTRIIHKYMSTLERNNETSSTDNDSSDAIDSSSQLALVSLLQDMGMVSALSKKDTSDYYETIARQISDLLRPRMDAAGGVMALTDVYCLINRARSSHLLSPEDLLEATEVLSTLNLGLKARVYSSGLMVLQDARLSDKDVAELLRDACAQGMTALEASILLKTTPLLAQEQLLIAEQLGYLARDDQTQVVRFFCNRFDDWTPLCRYEATNAGRIKNDPRPRNEL